MATTFGMPQWGITMEEGTVTEWVASVGQIVAEGDVLAVISTDKIDTEFESPVAGIVAARLVVEGDTVACGTDLIVIATDQEDLQAWTDGV
jgi:pyruvate/2-oxoglutarate dehydrogenase complex dihydrolipoamide acyltransferase (E2) component